MKVGIFNNDYSRQILTDLDDSQSYQWLINIGKTDHRYSVYCGSRSPLEQLFVAARLLKDIRSSQISEVILPNSHCIITGVLLGGLRGEVRFSQVAEGTLNYHKRSVGPKELVRFILKRVICAVSLLKFKPNCSDPINLKENGDYKIYCRMKEGLVTNAKSRHVVKYRKPYVVTPNSNAVVIAGQHISDSVCDKYLKEMLPSELRDYLRGKKIYYQPHPRSADYGAREIEMVYEGLDLELLSSGYSSLEEAVCGIGASDVVTVGGTSAYLDFVGRGLSLKMHAFGFSLLVLSGFSQYKDLRGLHENLGVKIY